MALAQGTDVVLLDEPTTYLDLAHQVDVLDLVERLNREMGRTVVMVLHDLNLAARYAGRLVAMRAGRIVASGTPTRCSPKTCCATCSASTRAWSRTRSRGPRWWCRSAGGAGWTRPAGRDDGPAGPYRPTARASRPATSSATAGRLSTLPNASAADCSSSSVTTLLSCTSLSWP